jgi:hypothetical protein
MYVKHFGLLGFPFDKDIPAEDLFVSTAMQELSVRLSHLIEMSGIGLLTGDPGSGKSCAARAMTARLHFLFEEKRRVHKDRTVSLDGVLYEVDAALVGEVVVLRYDPARRGAPVDVWHQGKKACTARVVDAYANCFVKRNHDRETLEPDAAPDAPTGGLRMRDLGKEGK